ncbi:hypothetical protein GGS21DRAFT_493839 [Xylaria nigripes]|nr:hypothetical protein GGS21DRAFT_493839 [Xylaria nigripes]
MESCKSSIGVELEFLVCVAEEGQQLTVPAMFQSSKGGPLFLPRGGGEDRMRGIAEKFERIIAEVTTKHRGNRVIQSWEEILDDQEAYHLQSYQKWTIGSDPTVMMFEDEKSRDGLDKYVWHPTEISSPALWATEDSWEEIRAVIQALVDDHWIIAPRLSGMHFHYGHGKEYIPFKKLRRMAALFLAVDPILVQLQPPYRRNNVFCLSNRVLSRAAHGKSAKEMANDIGVRYIEAEPEMPRERHEPRATRRPFHERNAGFSVPFKRGELTGYLDKSTMIDKQFEIARGGESPNLLAIPLAVREILQCRNAPTVAELMTTTLRVNDRSAYSFHAYRHWSYKKVFLSSGRVHLERQRKRTIEFRQMASTLVPEEIVAHGKVLVRLCEFAGETDLNELWRIILDCSVAEDNGEWYDVFDLLAELGLNAEAKALVKPVARFMDKSIC